MLLGSPSILTHGVVAVSGAGLLFQDRRCLQIQALWQLTCLSLLSGAGVAVHLSRRSMFEENMLQHAARHAAIVAHMLQGGTNGQL
jgi:hypothetical protein